MLNKTIRSVLAVAALSAGSFAMPALAGHLSSQSSMITVAETETGTSGNITVKLSVSQMPMANLDGVRRPAAPGGVKLQMSSYPWPKWGGATTFQNNKDTLDAFGNWMKFYSNRAASQVCALLKGSYSNAHSALVNYFQSVTINGKPARVGGTLLVKDDCSHQFMGVKIENAFDNLIYAVYMQGATKQGLPSGPGWNMPSPGQLQWELIKISTTDPNAQPQPVKINGKVWQDWDYLCSSSDQSSRCPVHANGPLGPWGYYDAPQNIEDSNGKVEYYHCAMGSDGYCDQFAPTNTVRGGDIMADYNTGRNALINQVLHPLIQEYNAQSVMLDYGETVQPVYTSSGSPITAVKVTQRKLTQATRFFFISPANGGKFENKGQYGFLLRYAFDRSITQQAGSGSQGSSTQDVQEVVKNVLSPQQAYSKQVSAKRGKGINYYTPLVIDPFDTLQVYPWQNDTVNHLPASDYVSVAPITQ